ncbi:hypothetical protein [Mycobacteroides abscessus]|uniref:hypothetical protein n=1 Tax=Mycobacteroides abscessus TaxID=36809 RepID=UPI00266C0834|nr:hypothetical protein [Mycobacteroides abscessus]MDO3042129.1 hypothetical protein [Mycobacteroides abscessus subsp. abscessus]MDO3111619.1 hypothetical protein [Mycobacteroides abscessus subsp. massiliense]
MKADPEGLAALAARLASTAGSLAAVNAGALVHPPLAADAVSVGAATRLSSGGAALAGNISVQGADLADLATRLGLIAGIFTAQEEANAAAQASLSAAGRSSPPALPPLVRAPVAPDVRPPLAAPPLQEGEVLAAQFQAGSAHAGTAFGQACSSAAAAARAAAEDLRQVAGWLPEVWRSTVGGEALAAVFTSRADTFEALADTAEHLDSQRGEHKSKYETAVGQAPTTKDYDDNRQRLSTAVTNNARTGGLWASEVAAAVAERAELEQRAGKAHSSYLTGSMQATEPKMGLGDDGHGQPGAGAPAAPGDTNSAANAAGLPDGLSEGAETLGGAADALTDPESAQMMQMLLSALVGGLGGIASTAMQSISSLPQEVMGAGGQAMQGLTQAMSGVKPKTPDLSGLGTPKLDPGLDFEGPAGIGTAPAGGGGTEGLPAPGVSGAGPLTGPSAPAASAGTLGGGATAGGPAPGGGMGGPMAPPPGGMAGAGNKEKRKAEEQKVALPYRPNSEAVTGQLEERVVAKAAGTEPPPPPPPEQSRGPRITRFESETL